MRKPATAEPAVLDALRRLEGWMEAEDFAGWDPYDALKSPLLRALTLGSRRLGIVWVQLFKRSPINLRPLAGVPKGRNPKAVGLLLASYLRRWWTTGDESARARADGFADWLRSNASPGHSGAAWGYDFPWPNRGFFAPAGTPTVVNTAFIGKALLDAGDVDTARSACDFVLRDLERLPAAPDELCFSYTPIDRRCVYNASLLGAELLAAVYAATGEPELRDAALAGARYVVRRQRPDGSWRYGEDASLDGWVDNFHTGFVLCSLAAIGRDTGSDALDRALDAGYAFWRDRMFRDDGAPKYYEDRVWPMDAHAAAQAVLTHLAMAEREARGTEPEASALERARRSAAWAIEHLQDERGFFHYQVHRRYRIRIPYMRWSQAWMQRALRELAWVAAGRPRREP